MVRTPSSGGSSGIESPVEEKGIDQAPRRLALYCSYLVAAVTLQSLWSLSLAFVDAYALLVMRCLRNRPITFFFTLGDGIVSTFTFAGACSSAGITVLIGNDLGLCSENHCASFETATAMAFLSWFAISISFMLNFWLLAAR